MTGFENDMAAWLILVGRLGFAAVFAISARDKFRLDRQEVAMISALHLPMPEMLERLAGLFEVVCIAAILSGFGTRIAAVALGLFTLFLTLSFLRFWEVTAPGEKHIAVRNAFFANLGIMSGLLILAAIGPGWLALNYGQF